jgi:TetR/AcrR family transcriptional regulator, regulator of biofilm formation and stress response
LGAIPLGVFAPGGETPEFGERTSRQLDNLMRVPVQVRGEERRERILRATLAVIASDGIGSVTHRRVATEADVPLGSLTYWFAAKDDLLREALRLFVDEETERLRVVGEGLTEGMAPEAIADRFSEVLESGDGDGQVAQFELYLEAARNPALREVAQQCFAAYEEISRQALRAAGVEADGPLPALFVALADGIGLRRLGAGDELDLRDALLALFGGVRSPVA